jgi:hypothetical protein
MSAAPDTLLTPEVQAGQAGLPPFPTWPPPSGGAPVTAPELGPILSPYPYGLPQGPNISTAPPAPIHPYPSTFYPKKMPPLNGQNQQQSLPAWPHSRFNVLPDKASPSISAISPPPIMGPGSAGVHLTASQIGRNGQIVKTFPAGSFLDGYGNVITPTRTVGGLGN